MSEFIKLVSAQKWGVIKICMFFSYFNEKIQKKRGFIKNFYDQISE